MSDTKDAILRVAALMFAERGYAGTSIRDVAAAAGVSPAMVMKVAGSKQELFNQAASFEVVDLAPVPDADLARWLVQGVVTRRDHDEREPLTRAAALLLPAPSPDELRARFTEAYVTPLTERLGDAVRAQLVVSLLIGLAVSMRLLHQLGPDVVDADELVERCTSLVQAAMSQAVTNPASNGPDAH